MYRRLHGLWIVPARARTGKVHHEVQPSRKRWDRLRVYGEWLHNHAAVGLPQNQDGLIVKLGCWTSRRIENLLTLEVQFQFSKLKYSRHTLGSMMDVEW